MKHRIMFLLLVFTVGNTISAANKVLIISSYGTDYQWSNTIVDEINSELKRAYPEVELYQEFLSSEFLSDPQMWGDKMNLLLYNYREKPPLAIILISDEAWMAYRDADAGYFKNVPVLLCAVKPHSIQTKTFVTKRDSLRLSDFSSTAEVIKEYNATAVIREMNITGYLSLMDNLVNDLDQFVFITDSRFYGVYTRLLLEQHVEKYYQDIPVEYMDARFTDTNTLLSKLPKIPSTSGVLMTSWLTGEYGFEYSKDYIYSVMENKLSTPIFITNNIGLEKEYFVGGYFNESEFWGQEVMKIVRDILQGKQAKEITPKTFHDEQCHIAWKVFNHYKLNKSKLPAKALFYNRPDSFFVANKEGIILACMVFFIFLVFYFYTLRSNFKLHSTKRLLLKSIEETKTANKTLEKTKEDLTIALHKAEESDTLKSAFLANMSHEIRTPLNAIVGFSGVIVEIDDPKERAEFADLIQRNSDLLLQLISDILDISKIEAGMLDLTFNPVDAEDLCSNIVTSLQSRCKPGVKLYLDKHPKPITLYTDHNRLMQIIINLATNATKFTDSGSIEIGYFPYDDQMIEFYVKDTGIGLSPDKLSAVFERFTKLNSYVEGTGLGLSICQTIVKMLGGEIGVESVEGVGSHFWFRILKDQRTATK